jgi:hypothetical protein
MLVNPSRGSGLSLPSMLWVRYVDPETRPRADQRRQLSDATLGVYPLRAGVGLCMMNH